MDPGDIFFKQPGRGMENYGAISSPVSPPNGSASGRVSNSNGHAIGSASGSGSGGTQTCPTCRGTGFVHPDQENELVALIPLKDKRLKPRRTMLYVCLAVFLCAMIGALLMFFLLPRTIELSSHVPDLNPMSTNISVLDQYVVLSLRNEYNITNQNFFPITITKLEVRVLFDGKVMADSINTTVVNVNLRSTQLYSIDFNITFTEDTGYLAYFCNRLSLFGHHIWMPFQATATTSYYGHTEESTLNFMQQVRCSGRNNDTQVANNTSSGRDKVNVISMGKV